MIQQLKEILRKTTYLESQLRSLSASTLSMSSSSSLGSLSTSSSKGSLSSVSFSDIYGLPQCTADTGLCALHKRVEKLLQASNSSIANNEQEATSPPTSPLDVGPPPPAYECNKAVYALADRFADVKVSPTDDRRRLLVNLTMGDSSQHPAWSSGESGYPAPPLSPIHEHGSSDLATMVADQQSGTQTSVSAAVSNESVAGDSGVFEASNKRFVHHSCLCYFVRI